MLYKPLSNIEQSANLIQLLLILSVVPNVNFKNRLSPLTLFLPSAILIFRTNWNCNYYKLKKINFTRLYTPKIRCILYAKYGSFNILLFIK